MNILYAIHSFVRRNLSYFERFLVAGVMAFLAYSLFQALPVYPTYWDIAIAAAVFGLMLVSPVWGYFFTIAVMLYPLYSISLYLAVLFLAVTVIGQHIFIRNLGGSLLTLFSPILGGVYLPWIIPLLGGLWWGPVGGAVMGAMAALWGQLLAGMVGLDPDWLTMLGFVPDTHFIAAHFSNADSLETLLKLISPLAPDSTRLLYNLLQIASWSFVGWAVGMLSGKEWMQYRRPRSTMLLAAGGAFSLAILQMALSLWLTPVIRPEYWQALGLAALLASLVVIILEAGQDFLEHPLPLRKSSPNIQLEMRENKPPTPEAIPNLPEVKEKDKPDDLIMLELD